MNPNPQVVGKQVTLKVRPGYWNRENTGEQFSAQDFSAQFAKGVTHKLFPKTMEYGNIQSHFNTERLGSYNFMGFKDLLLQIHQQRRTLTAELRRLSSELNARSQDLENLRSSFFSFLFSKKIAAKTTLVEQLSNQVEALRESQSQSTIALCYEYEHAALANAYSDLTSAFLSMKSAKKIWDVTTTQMNFDTKAAAGTSITRNEVKFDCKGLEILFSTVKVLHVENFNGGDFYFYPLFIAYYKGREEIAIIDYSDLYIEYKDQQFLEQPKDIAADVTNIGETWYRVNKDGSPDKRFVGNYKIPIVLYGALHIKSPSGINELYYISDHNKARHFCQQYLNYQALVRTFGCEVLIDAKPL